MQRHEKDAGNKRERIPETSRKMRQKIYHTEVKIYGSTAQHVSDERKQKLGYHNEFTGKIF